MKAHPSLDANSVIKARSVQTFVNRVNITFTVLLLLGECIMFSLIYLPLSHALQTSLIHNFNQISSVNYHSFQNNIQRGLEGARSLSSRTMIKNAIEDYQSRKMRMDELIAYTQSKYEDGAKALQYLVLAERLVDDVVIARYAPSENSIDTGFVDLLLSQDTGTDLKIYMKGDHIYSVILSPIMTDSKVLGYDRLVFDLTDHIQSLCTDIIETSILNGEANRSLTREAKIVSDHGEMSILSAPGFYLATTPVQDNIYFVSKQSRSTLFAPINQLSIMIFIASVGTLLGFIIAVYLYVVRFAKRMLGELDGIHTALREVASEVNIDSLTKAGSRRYGTKDLMRAFTNFRINGSSPAIIMFDIDCFKSINDGYGHDVGDQVLIEVVDAIYKTIRNEDKLFRWGGDEFVGIFYGVKEEKAAYFAGKILDTVSSLEIDADNETISPTISMGVSYFKAQDTEFSDALKRADQAMYMSKAEGRNRVNVL